MGATEKLKEQTGLAKTPRTIHELLLALRPQVELALPKHLNAERMIRIALTCIKTNPKLMECDPQSILASIMLSSQLGLEPGVLGQSFLVPYSKTCTLVPGWLGFLDLVNRAGKATAWTGAVYRGDEFEYWLGDSPYLKHRPCGDEEELTHTYAIARTLIGGWPIVEVWPVQKTKKHRDKYNKVGEKHYSFKHFEMYARKVPLLQALKYVPRSIELGIAYQLDAQSEMGQQRLRIDGVKDIVDGIIATPSPEEETKQEESQGEAVSHCKAHGDYKGDGNCPKCEEGEIRG